MVKTEIHNAVPDATRRLATSAAALISVLGGLSMAEPALGAGGGLQIFPTGFPNLSEMHRFCGLLVLFVLLVPVLDRVVFRPLLAVLDAREDSTAGARRRAAALNREAEQLIERRERALREVRARAQEQRTRVLETALDRSREDSAAAQTSADERGDASRTAIAESLDAARRGTAAEAEQLARAIAGRLLGRDLA